MSRSSNLRARDDLAGAEPPRPAAVVVEAPIAPPAEPASILSRLDAAGRIGALSRAFEAPAEQVPPSETVNEVRAGIANRLWAQRRRALKTLIGIAIIAVAGWLPVRALLETTSTQAIINARLITLRAPIEGQIGPLGAVSVGTTVQPGAALVGITNPRAERGRLDDLRRLVDEVETEIKTLVDRRRGLEALREGLSAQTQAFRAARMDQLDARIAEARSDIAAGEAKRQEADQALARARSLDAAGSGTRVTLEKAQRDATVAEQTLAALRHRLSALEVERSALRDGIFVGDSYNDRPQSLQRADEIALRLNEITAEISHRSDRVAHLRSELAGEQDRYAARAAATLVSPVGGSIWEVMTAPGETVVRGQDLMRVLDCTGLVVTATVGETAYNQLRIGEPARFRFRGESAEHEGRIIGLTGIATAPANLAIQPSALAKEPYRVTVALPELSRSGNCNVGRTGRVTFGK